MTILLIVVSGVVATTVMTAFSYLLSRGKSEQFREPELLNSLMARSDVIELNPSRNSLWGWFLHYMIGWLFVAIFYSIWHHGPFSPGIVSGGAMGLVAGIVGILGWQTMFALSANPPEIPLTQFYLHLLVAHILFGMAAASVFVLARFL